MQAKTETVLKEALGLPAKERAGLADCILSSLDAPDSKIDDAWRKEIDDRLTAYEAGKMETVSAEDVLRKHTGK